MLYFVTIHSYPRRMLLQSYSFYMVSRSFGISPRTRVASNMGLRWFKERFKQWFPAPSKAAQETAEKEVLSYLRSPFKAHFVNIGPMVGREDCEVRTLSMNERSERKPIVLLHGFGMAIGSWLLNLDAIAAERPVHAIDIPGFGRSTRLPFSTLAQETEMQIVDCIEAWRREMKLEKIILLGFSMGGFLATSYAFRYPNRLSHLILMDPWGFPKKTDEMTFLDARVPFPGPPIVGSILHLVMRPFNGLLLLRLFGKLRSGDKILRSTFPVIENFSVLGANGVDKVIHYLYQINSQEPTGEVAFRSMSSTSGPFWAMFPMGERISTSLDKNVPLTFIYGTKSWLCKIPASEIRKMRPTSYIKEVLIDGAGHECNISESRTFNTEVIKACDFGDKNFKT